MGEWPTRLTCEFKAPQDQAATGRLPDSSPHNDIGRAETAA